MNVEPLEISKKSNRKMDKGYDNSQKETITGTKIHEDM